MKKTLRSSLLICALFCFYSFAGYAQTDTTSTTFILVRHAEKMDDGTQNPELTADGNQRAERLAEWLQTNYEIAGIFSTAYKRTTLTAMPAAQIFGHEVQTYDFKDPAGFLKNLAEAHKGKNLLIVGHSNTVPYFVNLLTGQNKLEALSEDVYDQIFIVTVTEFGKQAEVERHSY